MTKYLCIHGHFYQPPRENPWLNEVELQDSAYPFHDWNERITAECYARNSASRMLDEEGRIIEIINNYARISFNFGPTLLQWMERKATDIYEAILEADKESINRFSGHGSALAQVFNHMIMPLANDRDKHTQVIWGIRDFQKRFNRDPEGMWLGETAADNATLEVLADHGIKFTILAPNQAKRVRKIGSTASSWTSVAKGNVDPKQPYLCKLPSGKQITLFFYDGPVSQAVAFENLLSNGQHFAERLMEGFIEEDKPQLMHIATDGETYGHHHGLGEMALSYALYYAESYKPVDITIYGEYLERHPPEQEVEIIENSSWSCVHGVERWRSDCGCHTGGQAGWNQKWRKPLREAFDWLREELIPVYEEGMQPFTTDPWSIRDEYIEVVLNRSKENVKEFLNRHVGRELSHDESVKILKLLEMQYHAMLMYTSCGWFFDEVTGIEAMQDIFYATRAHQLAHNLTDRNFENTFIKYLEQAPSNLPEFGNAATAYRKYVQPTRINLLRVGAHYAVSSIFSPYPEKSKLYSFMAEAENYEQQEAGKQRLVIGRVTIRSEITWEEQDITFAVLHLGEHHLFGGVREFIDGASYDIMNQEISNAFQVSNVHELLNLLDKHFGTHNYSFWHLFRDDQRKILNQTLQKTTYSISNTLQHYYEDYYPLMQAIGQVNMKLPRELKLVTDFVINSKLQEILDQENPDLKELQKTIRELKKLSLDLDKVTLKHVADERITRMMVEVENDPKNIERMGQIIELLQIIGKISLSKDLWRAQNICFYLRVAHYDEAQQNAEKGDAEARQWLKAFHDLAAGLNMKV